jgi:hypothetical protein
MFPSGPVAIPPVSQRLPSGPDAIEVGRVVAGSWYSVRSPEVVILSSSLEALSTNQRLPSGPPVIPSGLRLAVGMVYSMIEGDPDRIGIALGGTTWVGLG